MLTVIDKGYYDYDYKPSEKKRVLTMEATMKTDAEISNIMMRFGIGNKAEALQAQAMKEQNT
jgi:hypothetical protein